MKCADIDRILDDHHFSRLPRSDQAAVEDHLRQCVRCAPLWQASELLASEVPPAIPASAFDRVLRKIESPAEASLSVAEPVVKRSLLERLAVPVGLAATALIAALVVLQPDPAMRPLGDSAGTLLSREPVDSRSAEAALAAGVPRFVEGQHYFRIADTQVNLPSGDEADFGSLAAVCERDAGIGRDADSGGNSGDDFERDTGFDKGFRFFAAAAKDKRVAAFETDHDAPGACLGDQ